MDNPEQRLQRDTRGPISPKVPARRRRMFFYLLLGASVIIFALYNAAELMRQNRMDSRFAPQRRVNLKEPVPTSDDARSPETMEEPCLRVAIAPVISPEKSLQLYRGLVNHLAEKSGRRPVSLQRGTYGDVNDLLHYGRCDVAFVCTYAFVRGEREFGMEALVVPEIDGAVTYHSLILVPRSSKATSLLDLRGKTFASADILSNSGWLYPAIWLKDQGEDATSFFGKHEITGSHDRSVTAVASAYVDGAAVDSLVFDQMVDEDSAVASRTKVILKSPPFGMPPVVVPRQIDPDLKQQLLSILLQMHADAEGKKVLASLRIDRFVAPDDALFDSVREAATVWEGR